MIVHEIFAHIHEGKVVNKLICENYPAADHLAKCIYGDNAYAVDINQYPVEIGDLHIDGYFVREDEDGVQTTIVALPTQEQQVSALTENVTQLQTATEEIKETLNPTIDTTTCTLAELQEYTITQFGKSCSTAIYAGSDVETEKGTKHFSYKEEDQTNLSSAVNLAIMTGLDIPYHADGEDCCLWSAADIVNIYGTNELLKTYQTTYCNLMNGLIRNSRDKETILSMSYGDALPDDKQIDLDAAVQQSQKIYQTLVKTLSSLN